MSLCLTWIIDLWNMRVYEDETRGKLTSISSLPDDIIIDILSRLPVKSVKACKLVCSSWLHLSSLPEFAEMYVNRANPILLVDYKAYTKFYVVLISGTGKKPTLQKVCLDRMESIQEVNLYASCKGLLLFKNAPNILIWNPTTGEKIVFIAKKNLICGFFFHEKDKEYKLLCYHCDQKNMYNYSIYGLRSKARKYLKSPNLFPVIYDDPAVALYGALFWRVEKLINYNGVVVLCDAILMLCLETESILEKPYPRSRRGSKDKSMKLLDVDGKLCSCNVYSMTVEIWILGDLQSWTWFKRYMVSLDPYAFHYRPQVLGILNGNLLLHWPYTGLIWYNLQLNSSQKITTWGIDFADNYKKISATIHTSSFVSLRHNFLS